MKKSTLLKKKNVVAVGYGFKRSKGLRKKIHNFIKKLKGEKSILVFVEKREDLESLSAKDIVPKEFDGMETDVIEVGIIEPLRRVTLRPIYGGISAMWEGGTACTLGAIIFKNGKPYGLSNEHCFNPWWNGAKKGDKILQASPLDGGRNPKDIIAEIVDDKKRLVLDGKTKNIFDTSIQPINADIETIELYQDTIGKFEPEPDFVKAGEEVQKHGRTTFFTKTRVIATDVDGSIYYDRATNKLGIFENQIMLNNGGNWNFVNGGDSGSLVLNMKKRPIGQVYGGSSLVVLVAPIVPIMQEFGFTFDKDGVVPEKPVQKYYVSAGKDWYIEPVIGKTKTKVRLNLRTEPRVHASTLVETLPIGKEINIVRYVGRVGEWEWCEITLDK